MSRPQGGARRRTSSEFSAVVIVQEHGPTKESWGIATVELVEVLLGEAPRGIWKGTEFKAVGDRLGLSSPGERLELRGRFESSKWGLQLKVSEQRSLGIQAPRDACRWLERLSAVGPKRARALYQQFGDDLPQILSGEIEADLTVVSGINDDVERHIRESFAELAISGDLESLRYLDSLQVTRWEAGKIVSFAAKQLLKPRELLEERPYDLMQVKGLGFLKVDKIALAAGCQALAPARLEAAALFQLEEITSEGSTMVPLVASRGGGLVGAVCELLSVSERDLVHAAIQRLAARGLVVIAADEEGKRWVHPSALLKAERLIYRAACGLAPRRERLTGKTTPGETERGLPGGLPAQASVKGRRPGRPLATAGTSREEAPAAGRTPPPAPSAREAVSRAIERGARSGKDTGTGSLASGAAGPGRRQAGAARSAAGGASSRSSEPAFAGCNSLGEIVERFFGSNTPTTKDW